MINQQYKVIFIHVPKTGGNSISSSLKDYFDDDVVMRKSAGNTEKKSSEEGVLVINKEFWGDTNCHKHASLQNYYNILGEKINEYTIISGCREPKDRILSSIRFSNKLLQKKIKNILGISNLILPKEQYKYLLINGKFRCDKLIKYENIQQDFEKICVFLGIENKKLPHINKSKREPVNLTKKDIRKIRQKYKEDYLLFKYRI
jgi:hypothetical protein